MCSDRVVCLNGAGMVGNDSAKPAQPIDSGTTNGLR